MIDNGEAAVYSEEARCFLDSKLVRLNEILQDYDPYLVMKWVPYSARTDAEKSRPYCIVHEPPNEKPYVVLYFGEADQPEQVLAKIFAGDNWNKNVLANIEAQEAATKAFQQKKHLEELEESADMFHFLFTKRSKNYVKWKDRQTGETVKLNSHRRRC